ncbi:hypothetical protein U1Q18_001986 [Sarracenia purpurea var. burkii]
MADTAVQFLLENLKQLLLYNAKLIVNVRDHVEGLIKDLSMLKAFLEDATEKRSEYKVVQELVRNIRTVTYQAEDAIDTFVVEAAVQKARSKIQKMFHIFDYPAKLRSVATEVETVREEVKKIYESKMFGFEAFQRRDSGEGSGSGRPEKKAPVVEEENVVGFDEEATTIIGKLTGGTEDLQVISLIGMPGLGKTTLARKVYTDPRTVYEFSTRAWVYVSVEYNRKEVFLSILSSVSQGSVGNDMKNMSAEMIAEEVRRLLTWKYLIVVDDVWTTVAWDDIKMAFPNLNKGSRVLLTSRNREVAVHANPDPASPPHQLPFLTPAESWKLLKWKAFGRGACVSELVGVGKQIAAKCDGLPLAIVVVGGLLLNKPNLYWWEKVAASVKSLIVRNPEQCMDVLALSYTHLPHHLKACFLYFGVFPEDYEIPVWKLIRLWIAEGFIQNFERACLEDTAEEYLEDLVGRNLVLVVKRGFNGRIKTCRIHDMLRDLCLREAKAENFFWEIKELEQVTNSPSSSPDNRPSDNYRRLCVHSRILDYISLRPSGLRVRSFLCFPTHPMNLPKEQVSFIPEVFRLLRVFEIQLISFPRFPNEIIQLVHLRHIAISGNFKILPEPLSNLWNLQTLIVQTPSRTIDIKADLWKMFQLRHVHTRGTSQLHGPPPRARKDHEDPFVRRNLQTLSTITPESCSENVLARTPSLKKLGIKGKLANLMEDGVSFDNLTKLDQLVTLKLLNDIFPRPPSEGKLTVLPQWYKFPPNLKKLTLSDTFLGWKHMSVLAMLPSLEVLKLRDNAFTGIEWSPLEGGFRQLKVLQIGKTDLVYWEATPNHFPKLQHLVLRDCTGLEAIPSGLGDVKTLQTIELYRTSPSAANSARKILQQQKESGVNNKLKVHIFPPDL